MAKKTSKAKTKTAKTKTTAKRKAAKTKAAKKTAAAKRKTKKTTAKKKATKKKAAKKKATKKKATKKTAAKKTAAKKKATKKTAAKKTAAKKTAAKKKATKKTAATKTAAKKTAAKKTAAKTKAAPSPVKKTTAKKKATKPQPEPENERDILLHDALRFQRLQDFSAAERQLRRFIESWPDDLRGLIHLSIMQRQRGNRDSAFESIKAALKKDKDSPMVLWYKADFHLSEPLTPDLAEAQKSLKRIVQLCGRKRDTDSRRWTEEAKDKLKYCESRKYALESRKHLQKGNKRGESRARDLLRKALNTYPNDPRNHMNLGSIELKLGKPQVAIELLEEAIERDPAYARAHLYLGQAYEQLGLLVRAREAYLQCIEHDTSKRDSADAWRARRRIEHELARRRRQFFNTLTRRVGDQGEPEPLDLHAMKGWVEVLEGEAVAYADLRRDDRGAYVLTAYGQDHTYRVLPGPEGLVVERA